MIFTRPTRGFRIRQRIERLTAWHKVFAWYPVPLIDPDATKGSTTQKYAFGQFVLRRYGIVSEYRDDSTGFVRRIINNLLHSRLTWTDDVKYTTPKQLFIDNLKGKDNRVVEKVAGVRYIVSTYCPTTQDITEGDGWYDPVADVHYLYANGKWEPLQIHTDSASAMLSKIKQRRLGSAK